MAVILAAALACASGKLPRRAHATLAGTVKPAPDGRGADDARGGSEVADSRRVVVAPPVARRGGRAAPEATREVARKPI